MVERAELAPGSSLSRLIKGHWQLGDGHGATFDRRVALADMAAFVEAGITTFACADHYIGVEELIGDFRRAYPSLAKQLQVYTCFVPDLERLANVDAVCVESIIDRSLQRLGVERLDLLQFAWWDYRVPRELDAAALLIDLRKRGKIAELGVTNFDTPHLEALWGAGYRLRGNQLQSSLLDHRPEAGGQAEFCRVNGIAMLAYGTLAGGFLSDRWVGLPEPQEPYANRSLRKYKLIIDDFGGWFLFQDLLRVLRAVADRHGATIAQIAMRWSLDQPGLTAIMAGTTSSARLGEWLRVFDLRLDAADHAAIAAVLARRRGPLGDCFTIERDRTGRHGRIMRYNQNAGRF